MRTTLSSLALALALLPSCSFIAPIAPRLYVECIRPLDTVCEDFNTGNSAVSACYRYQCSSSVPGDRGRCELRLRDDDSDGAINRACMNDPRALAEPRPTVDCDDDNPDALGVGESPEVCNHRDDDCDGWVDEAFMRMGMRGNALPNPDERASAGMRSVTGAGGARWVTHDELDGVPHVALSSASGEAIFADVPFGVTRTATDLRYASLMDHTRLVTSAALMTVTGCPIEAGGSINSTGACNFADAAMARTRDVTFVASVNGSGCAAGQLRVGFLDTMNRSLLRGPLRRSNTFLGVDLDATTRCTGASAGSSGATRPTLVAMERPTVNDHALVAYVGASHRDHPECGGAAVPVRALEVRLEQDARGMPYDWVTGANEGVPVTVGMTTGGGRPGVAVRSTDGYLVGWGNGNRVEVAFVRSNGDAADWPAFTEVETPVACTTDAQCPGEICQDDGGACASVADCATGTCNLVTRRCGCSTDADCTTTAGERCVNGRCGMSPCTIDMDPVCGGRGCLGVCDPSCTLDSECTSGICDPIGRNCVPICEARPGRPAILPGRVPCAAPTDCRSSTCMSGMCSAVAASPSDRENPDLATAATTFAMVGSITTTGPADDVRIAFGKIRGNGDVTVGVAWREGCGTPGAGIFFQMGALSSDHSTLTMEGSPVALDPGGDPAGPPALAYVARGILQRGIIRPGDMVEISDDITGGWHIAWVATPAGGASPRIVGRRVGEEDGTLVPEDLLLLSDATRGPRDPALVVDSFDQVDVVFYDSVEDGVYRAGVTCEPSGCGGIGLECCGMGMGEACDPTLACHPVMNRCVQCGISGALCCDEPEDPCNPGLACNAMSGTCAAP